MPIVVQIAVVVIALSFAAAAGCVIATLLPIRRAAIESHVLLTRLNAQSPHLLRDVQAAAQAAAALATDARQSIRRVESLLHAVEGLGDAMDDRQGRAGSVISTLSRVVSGVKAVSAVIRGRFRQDDGDAKVAQEDDLDK